MVVKLAAGSPLISPSTKNAAPSPPLIFKTPAGSNLDKNWLSYAWFFECEVL